MTWYALLTIVMLALIAGLAIMFGIYYEDELIDIEETLANKWRNRKF